MTTLGKQKEKASTALEPNFNDIGKFADLSSRQLHQLDMTLVLTAYGSQPSVNLSYNFLSTLPPSFSQYLRHVQVLDLSCNQLTALPDNFDLLQNLHTLILYKNKLQTLPVCFGNLDNLRWLDLSANPLDPLLRRICGPHLAQGTEVAKNIREFFYLLLTASENYEKSDYDAYNPSWAASPIFKICTVQNPAPESHLPWEKSARAETPSDGGQDMDYERAAILYEKKLQSLLKPPHSVKESTSQFLFRLLRYFTIYTAVICLILALWLGPPKTLEGTGRMKEYPGLPSILINAVSWFLYCTVYQLRGLSPSLASAARVFVETPTSPWHRWFR